jgi:D-amino-acid dehydrogenase
MRVAVLGGGVIGVASAYFLAQAGHQVTLVERQAGPALETSFANAGEISAGHASPWMAPGVPLKALKWLFARDAPLILRPRLDPAMLGWMAAALAQCNIGAYARNKRRMLRLAQYSRDQLDALRAETKIAYDEGTAGVLHLLHTARERDGIATDVDVLRGEGVAFELLEPAACYAREPGLKHSSETFVLRFGEQVTALSRSGGRIEAALTDRGAVVADTFVVALGSHSRALVAPLGLRLPIYPVKGYSITADVLDPERAPVSSVLDEVRKVAITRLGDRIRIGGIAEVSGYGDALPPARRRALAHAAGALFPGAGDWEGARFWTGLRPMTPDGAPIIGPTPIENLYLNTGHGSLGWTMACGSARIIADVAGGEPPEIDIADLGLGRYA